MRSVLMLMLLLLAPTVYARDGGGMGRPHVCDMAPGPRLEKCQNWIGTLQRPDYRGASCCGEADAFIADDFVVDDRGLWAIISADYPDVSNASVDEDGNEIAAVHGHRRGDRILIPPEKINTRPEDAGASGHGVVFLRPSDGEVLCFRFPPLT